MKYYHQYHEDMPRIRSQSGHPILLSGYSAHQAGPNLPQLIPPAGGGGEGLGVGESFRCQYGPGSEAIRSTLSVREVGRILST